jgi:small-conductance mechanosensitive channel
LTRAADPTTIARLKCVVVVASDVSTAARNDRQMPPPEIPPTSKHATTKIPRVRARQVRPSTLSESSDMSFAILRTLFLLLLASLTLAPAVAATPSTGTAAATKPMEATLTVANRDITVFRSTLLGYDPASRAERSRERIGALDNADLEKPVKAFEVTVGELSGISIYVGDKRMFSLVPEDLDPEDRTTLAQAAEDARARLAGALAAKRDMSRWPVLLNGLLHAAVATALFAAFIWTLRRLGRSLRAALARRHDALAADTSTDAPQWRQYLIVLLMRMFRLFGTALALILGYAWITYAFENFPLTQPLGRELVRFVGTLGSGLLASTVGAAPGIATIAVILFMTRAVVEVIGRYFASVQSGRTSVNFLHPETVPATRRIITILVWVFAIAVAYPFIPGSGSEAFKGLSVLIGVMVSLGSTGLINQMMGGLVLVYSRALRRGDFVVVDDVEGVVTEVGALATKVVTMRNEEITIPNSVLTATRIRNYSKLAGTHGTMLSTKVTIGYDAPWRQVHAMLALAAERTPGLRRQPAPIVYQRALSDFYVEYELLANTDRPGERVPILSALHQNIQDVFNEHGVQILSPHFVLQPTGGAVVVPRDQWYAAPARKPESSDS